MAAKKKAKATGNGAAAAPTEIKTSGAITRDEFLRHRHVGEGQNPEAGAPATGFVSLGDETELSGGEQGAALGSRVSGGG